MPLGDHIEELRRRVIVCLLVLAAALFVTWFFRQWILEIVALPHRRAMQALRLDPALKFRSYVDPMLAQLKVCVVTSLILVSPLLLYELWAFMGPGLFPKERQAVMKLGGASVLCLAAGVSFGYFVFIPLALRFLLLMSGPATEPVLMIDSYLSLFVMLTLALGLVFQTPMVVYYLVRWGVVDVATVRKYRKAAILVAFILAAFLTPPDPFTQVMMAVPAVLLYDLGTLAAARDRRTLVGFLKFALTVGAVAGGVAAWFLLWPIGRLEVIKGTAALGAQTFEQGETHGVTRGQVCSAGESGTVKISMDDSTVLLAPSARVHVQTDSRLALRSGTVLAKEPGSAELEVRTEAASAVLRGAEAEFQTSDGYGLTIRVISGEVEVRSDGAAVRLSAGKTATFGVSGDSFDGSAVRRRWNELIRPQ